MKLNLIKITDEAKGTKSFYWKPEAKINFLPGQYYYFTLPKLRYNDKRGPTRHFTISTSPTEGEVIRFTTRIRAESGYKKTLANLKPGAQAEGEGPNGTYILDENEPGIHLMIAGGIGITAFRVFIKYNIDRGLKDTKLYLLYSNSLPEEIAYKNELQTWAKIHENIKIALTITKPEKSKEKWTGLTGRIDEKMIKNIIKEWGLKIAGITFWVCGPPAMVDAVESLLKKMGIQSSNVRTEKFTGY